MKLNTYNILFGILLISLSLSYIYGESYYTTIDILLDEPFRVYQDGELIDSPTPVGPGRPDAEYHSVFQVFNNTQKTVVIRIEENGYKPYEFKVKIGEKERIEITQNMLTPMAEADASEDILNATLYLNTIKLKYSDSTYKSCIDEAYELLNMAKDAYDNKKYTSASQYARNAKYMGEDIYNTWKNIDKCDKLIIEYDENYKKYGNISEYKNNILEAKIKLTSKDYEDANSLANITYINLNKIITGVRVIDSVKNRLDNLKKDLIAEEYGLNPKLNLNLDNDINEAEKYLINRDLDNLNSKIKNINYTLSNYESSGKKSKSNIIKLYNIFNTKLKNNYKNIENIEPYKYNESYNKYKQSVESYNSGKLYIAETYSFSSLKTIIEAMELYNKTKLNLTNKINYLNNKILEIDGNNTNNEILTNMSLNILNNIKTTKQYINTGEFEKAKKLITKIESALNNIETLLKSAEKCKNQTIKYNNQLKNKIMEIKQKTSNEIIFLNTPTKLNYDVCYYYNEEKIKEMYENISKSIDKTYEQYNKSKLLLNKINNISKNLTYNISKYNKIYSEYTLSKQYYNSGKYGNSINCSLNVINEINKTINYENKLKNTKKYMMTHGHYSKLGGLIKGKINYSEENRKLDNAEYYITQGNYNMTDELILNITKSAKKKYVVANDDLINKIISIVLSLFNHTKN